MAPSPRRSARPRCTFPAGRTIPQGVKALALAAQRCFEHFRPGGMRVWAGSIILEPGLVEDDFTEIAGKGVWLAKAGFGQVKTPYRLRAAGRLGARGAA